MVEAEQPSSSATCLAADPRASILGGARYLRLIEAKIPDRIPEPDRLWLALAGYNVGFGHLDRERVHPGRTIGLGAARHHAPDRDEGRIVVVLGDHDELHPRSFAEPGRHAGRANLDRDHP